MTQAITTASHFMPILDFSQAAIRYQAIVEITNKMLRTDHDYGKVPGTDKNTLLKPGAEKLCTLFGLSPRFTIVEKTEDWTGADHNGESLFYYVYRCSLYRGDVLIAEADGSCNSRESKYRYRWVSEFDLPTDADKSALKKRGGRSSEFAFAIEKAETSGQYGKPAEYWQRYKDAIQNGTAKQVQKPTKKGTSDAWEIDSTVYRIPNDDIASQINTIQKMSQKRAFIAATLIAVNASEFFTQDVEDFVDLTGDIVVDASYTVATKPAQPVADPVVAAAQNMGGVVRPQPKPAQAPANGGAKTDPAAKRAQLISELTRVNGLLASAGLLDILKDNQPGNDSFSDLEAKIKRANDALEKVPA